MPCRRLEPVGYGGSRPIACSPPGESRRTELHIAGYRGTAIMDEIATDGHALAGDPCARASE